MKIAVLGSKVFDSLEYHVVDALKYLQHDVYHIDITDVLNIAYKYSYWIQKFSLKYDEKIFKKIAHKIIEQQPDLVICTYRNINPIAIKLLKQNLKNVKIVHLNPDAVTTFGDQQIFASPYDAYFTKDPFIVDFMKNKMDLNTIYLPEAFNHRIHRPPAISNRSEHEKKVATDVVAFGTMYPYRANVLNNLIKNGINVDLYGTPDKKFPNKEIEKRFKNEYITGERKAEVLYGAKIVFNNFHYAEVHCVNVKFFEIIGTGAFQICDYKPTIEEYSAIPAEKFTFKNIDEAIDLIKFYLNKPELRHELALKQHKHFLKHHTYDVRINELINHLL